MVLGLFDWIGDFFKSLFDLIPKIMYLLYASLACLLDVFQLFFRKLAGLDVYYVNGEAVTGDLITNFIAGIFGINLNAGADEAKMSYGALSTVFWSFVVFGIIILFVSTLVAIVKSHYSYDDKAAKGPMQYVYTALKSVVNIAAIPVIVMLGLYLSQAILTALDSFTSVSNGQIESLYGEAKDENGNTISAASKYLLKISTVKDATGVGNGAGTYICYDIFGFSGKITYGSKHTNENNQWTDIEIKQMASIGSTNQTFSGSMFRVAAYNANRARMSDGGYMFDRRNSIFQGGMEIFNDCKDEEQLAEMIDTAFACNLHFKDGWHTLNYDALYGEGIVSFKYFTNFLAIGSWGFSKFNVGLVWYFYDLWNFNFIVAFATLIVCVTLFINIILGLMTRLFMCIGLFLIYPPLFALAPLDGGKAGKDWTTNFMKQVLMAYGAVVGMNIFFIIMPLFNQIDFFNIPIADLFAQTLVIIVGLITIKAFISVISGLIGAADANETGGKISEEVGSTIKKSAGLALGAAKVATAPGRKFAHRVAAYGAEARADEAQQRSQDLMTEAHAARMAGDNDRADRLERRAAAKRNKAQRLTASSEQHQNAMRSMGFLGMKAAVKDTGAFYKRFVSNKGIGDVGALKAVGDTIKDRDDKAKSDAEKAEERQYRDNVTGSLRNVDHGLNGYDEQDANGNTVRVAGINEALNGRVQRDSGGRVLNDGSGNAVTRGGMRREMNRGFNRTIHDMNAGFTATNTELGAMHTDMNTGLAANEAATRTVANRVTANTGATTTLRHSIENAFNEANGHLDDISRETTEIKNKTNEIKNHTKNLRTRAKTAEQDRAKAQQELEKQTKELEKVRQHVKNIDDKT